MAALVYFRLRSRILSGSLCRILGFRRNPSRTCPSRYSFQLSQMDLAPWVARAGVNASPRRVNLFWGRFRLILIIAGYRNHQMGVVCSRKHHVRRTRVEISGEMSQ